MPPKAQRALVLGLILAGILLAGFFGLRAVFAFREFRRHGPPPFPPVQSMQDGSPETDVELIRDWMTIPYISKTYQVHPKIIFDALGISPRGNEGKSLVQLNEEYFPQAPGLVVELVKAAIQAHQAAPTTDSPTKPAPPSAP